MKILLACINLNDLAGSEMYHYELSRELHKTGVDVTLFALRPIKQDSVLLLKLRELGVKCIDSTSLSSVELNTLAEFDLIVASQPQVNSYILHYYPDVPIISIIHSEVRDENPILDQRICHYIAIRQSIVDLLVNGYGIPKEKVSLIYNPIDQSRYNKKGRQQNEKRTGVFIGGATDPLRFQALSHIVGECIERDWNLVIMSQHLHDFNHPNISYTVPRWDTENIVKHMDFTAGIFLGRTTLEGLCCGVPGYSYIVDPQGNILQIDTTPPDNIVQLCNSQHVASQHIELYKRFTK